MKKYWITVVSKEHLQNGIKGGFMQANHGKAAPLKRMHKGDMVIFYSPKVTFAGNEKLQAFTALGEIKDEEVYQVKMFENFEPFRRNVEFKESKEVSILPLIQQLEFIEDKTHWGFKFRFGFFEINEHDFKLISSSMNS